MRACRSMCVFVCAGVCVRACMAYVYACINVYPSVRMRVCEVRPECMALSMIELIC